MKDDNDVKNYPEYKRIDKLISEIFDKGSPGGYYLPPEERKILFSKQIQDWKKQNNKKTDPSDDELKQFIIKDFKTRYVNVFRQIREKYPDAKYKKEDGYFNNIPRPIEISLKYGDKELNGDFLRISNTLNGEIRMSPVSLRFNGKGQNFVSLSRIEKECPRPTRGQFVIREWLGVDGDGQDFIKQTNLHDVELSFENDKICVKSWFTIKECENKNERGSCRFKVVIVNQTEFTLDKGRITKIEKTYIGGKEQNPPITIAGEEGINKEIKNIFGDKNNTAIQNIIYELDDEQKKLITNGHPELLNEENIKEESNIGLKLEGVDDVVKKKINNHGICDSLKDCCTKFALNFVR